MFLLDPLHKTLPAFANVVEGSLIFNFALDHKVHFSLKIQRKFNLKTASAKYKRPGTPETRSAATSRAATSATRRMRRTRVGCAHRGTEVTTGHCVAPAETHLCCPWQVGRARWRWSTDRRIARGAPLAARAAHVAGHAPASPRVQVASAWPHLPPTDLLRAYKPALAAPRVHAHPPRATVVPPLAPPVRTSLQSTPSPPQVLEPFLVHHKSSPSRLLIKPSGTIAGARVPAAAAGPPSPSSPLRRSSAAARRRLPRLIFLHQSFTGESNQRSP
jgi:hypothetical protein